MILAEYEILSDLLVSLEVRISYLNVDWHHVAERVRQILDLFGPSGAPHQSLSVWPHLVEDLSDVLFKAHVLKTIED